MSLNLKKAIRTYKPIEKLGLTFYPITMEHYEEFQACKSVLTIRLGTLPIKYATMDYFTAIYSWNKDTHADIFGYLFIVLCLSLRISPTENNIRIYGNDDIVTKFTVIQNEKIVEITPQQYSTIIRPLIAEQNGIKLPDESENIDLIKDQEEMKELQNHNTKIKADLKDLIASVAYQSKVRETDIYEWTVLEFENRFNAISRDKLYTIYKQAQLSGMVEFKNGNPYETWYYDTEEDLYTTASYDKLMNTRKDMTI